MSLTSQQRHIVRLALDKASCPGDRRWSAGGLLAQIALLSGNTEAELKHWDEVGNGDGPLTLDRIQDSGNGFAGWPLDALVELDGAWRRGEGERALDGLLRASTDQPGDRASTVTEPYTGVERRGALSINFDLKSILFVIGFVAMILPLITTVMAIRQDQRVIMMRQDAMDAWKQAVDTRLADQEKAKLLYCSGRASVVRDSGRAASMVPDAGC